MNRPTSWTSRNRCHSGRRLCRHRRHPPPDAPAEERWANLSPCAVVRDSSRLLSDDGHSRPPGPGLQRVRPRIIGARRHHQRGLRAAVLGNENPLSKRLRHNPQVGVDDGGRRCWQRSALVTGRSGSVRILSTVRQSVGYVPFGYPFSCQSTCRVRRQDAAVAVGNQPGDQAAGVRYRSQPDYRRTVHASRGAGQPP